jgi:hypothetical protein
MESLWGLLKVGRLYGRKFETRRAAMDEKEQSDECKRLKRLEP